MKTLLDYTAVITDLSKMTAGTTDISDREIRTDLRLLRGPFRELEALKQWVHEQKEPLTTAQLYSIHDDLMNQLYQLYKAKKRKDYPFSLRIWEEFLNRDEGAKGAYQDLIVVEIGRYGEKHCRLEVVNPS
jgi:hypothetical protein